jgi:hypothetical protein
MIPSIHFQYSLMIPGKGARGFSLPKDPGACPYEMIMEETLMERSLPSLAIQGLQCIPTPLDSLEA